MAIKAWIECQNCGGAFIILRDPTRLPKNGDGIKASDFIRPGGGEYDPSDETEPCITCGEPGYFDTFSEKFMRTGDQYPDVTRERFAKRPLPGEDS